MKFFDLFAGIGGFRLALEKEGYACVGFCEKDRWARKLYKAYYGTEEKGEFEWGDILTLNPDDIPDFEVLTAGFPCQSFSLAGKKRGLKDERAYPLWSQMFRIIEVKRPVICIFENVRGLLSANRGWAFAYFLYKMDALGYDGEWTVLNSKAFGVPQNRERVYLVFYIRGKSRGKVFPITESDKIYYNPPKAQEEIRQDSKTELAGTLTARQYASWNGTYIREGSSIRRLTPLECFRLQGFPDNIYQRAKELNISDSQLYRLIGNSVTVQIIQTIARKLRFLQGVSQK